eukprot:CAMPEP_0119048114 /NCGR_PEP_ID=MMETSP1177-20130426/56975_1 /TAXON_ID=2985 /ORGANISM="Ochromonas sp, Strain CCMP1899" /LENGTH=278 /DNA_ID=CAMNT_0007023553 /DNA_START=456 /DNA_END=1288 /DNA_ORIENTATION=+
MVNRALDFCSGEELSSQEAEYERAIGHGDRGIDSSIPEGGNMMSHIKSISKTSRLILALSALVASLSFVLLIAVKRSQNIAVLFFVFLQPIVILYIVYWRKRRQYASFDFVIKCFAVGFWFTTFQSIILETLIQGAIGLSLAPFVFDSVGSALSGDPVSSNAIQNTRFNGYDYYQNQNNNVNIQEKIIQSLGRAFYLFESVSTRISNSPNPSINLGIRNGFFKSPSDRIFNSIWSHSGGSLMGKDFFVSASVDDIGGGAEGAPDESLLIGAMRSHMVV